MPCSLPVDDEKKSDLMTSLFTYLKVDQTPTIELVKFSDAYVPQESRDGYRQFMESRKFPLTAVPKDISDIASKLKRRKLVFRHDISLTGSPEAFRDLIVVANVEGDAE